MKIMITILLVIVAAIFATLILLNVFTKLEMETEIVFDAPKEKVWEVLTQTEKYSEWNPFITSIKGEMKQGAQLTTVKVNNGTETSFTPIITMFKENETLEWLGSGLGGMFKGSHYFKLTEVNGKTNMLHGENFSGLLSGLIMQMIGEDTHANFELMNEAMKKRVEHY